MLKFFKINIKKHDNRITNNWFLKIFLALLCAFPVFMAAFYYLKIGTALYIVMGTALISFGFLFVPFVFFKQKTAFLISIIWLLLSPLEIIHLVLYQESVGPGFLLLLFQTDFREMWELIVFHKLLTIVYIVTVILYLFLTIKFIKNEYVLSKRFRFSTLIILLFFMAGLYIFSFKSIESLNKEDRKNFIKINDAFLKKFKKTYPLNIFIAYNQANNFYREITYTDPEIQNFKFGAYKKKSIDEKEIYILVIGESARYNNLSINGYHRETTPLLSNTDNVISYSDVYSLANVTALSLPLMLTRATPQKFSISKTEKAVTDAFKEAGFYTCWISNQSSSNSYLRNLANRANYSLFTIKDIESVDNYDEDLYMHLKTVLSTDNNKLLIVLHTSGSHFRYNLRYPETFRKFTPDLEGMVDYAFLSKNKREQLVNSYDNSILYMDFFLSKIIEKLENYNAVSYLLYISDHGENLYDNNNYILHGSDTPSKMEVHIPVIAWFSEKYKNTYTVKYEAVKNNSGKKLTSDVIFYSLLDMADITIPDENFQKSIANPVLKDDSVRYVLNPKKEIVVFK